MNSSSTATAEKPTATTAPKSERRIVRTRDAGVFFGFVVEDDRATNTAVLLDARRLWYWDGAATLSQLAEEGVKNPIGCKFPTKVSRVELRGVIEILDVTSKAAESIDAVAIWKR